jgi:ParB/Sulfiredoxin domain
MQEDKISNDDGYSWIDPTIIKIVHNPRTVHNPGFMQEKMDELYRDIKDVGLNHPLAVWFHRDIWQLLGGERRLRTILRFLENNEICRCPKGSGKMISAQEAYRLVKCRVISVETEREAKRVARKDNMLHEALTDYEILKQVEEMERDGFSRSEQAEDFDKSEAWISQSHSLLALSAEYPRIREAMFQGQLGRTQALTFLPLWEKTPDKVGEIFDRAYQSRFIECRMKEADAIKEEEEALEDLDITESDLKLAEATTSTEEEEVGELRKKSKQAIRRYKKAEKKVASAKEARENVRLSVEDITTATRKTAGAEDVLSKPITVKNIRTYAKELTALLTLNEGRMEIEFESAKLVRGEVELLRNVMDWMVGNRKLKHPLELLSI